MRNTSRLTTMTAYTAPLVDAGGWHWLMAGDYLADCEDTMTTRQRALIRAIALKRIAKMAEQRKGT